MFNKKIKNYKIIDSNFRAKLYQDIRDEHHFIQINYSSDMLLIAQIYVCNNNIIEQDSKLGLPQEIVISNKTLYTIVHKQNSITSSIHDFGFTNYTNKKFSYGEFNIDNKKLSVDEFSFKRLLLVDNSKTFEEENELLRNELQELNSIMKLNSYWFEQLYLRASFKPIYYDFKESELYNNV